MRNKKEELRSKKATAFPGLADWFERIEPKGKWAWLGSTYEAFHTFAFTPKTVTKSGSHIRDAVDMKRGHRPHPRPAVRDVEYRVSACHWVEWA